jgi:hypothetical protein
MGIHYVRHLGASSPAKQTKQCLHRLFQAWQSEGKRVDADKEMAFSPTVCLFMADVGEGQQVQKLQRWPCSAFMAYGA